MKNVSLVESIAKLCHETNRIYCASVGDYSQLDWDNAPDWQRESAIKGVEYHLDNRDSKPSDSHESWMKEKLDNGWVYGEVKDPVTKTHPCIVPFDKLPEEQQMKDILFLGTVHESIDIDDEYVRTRNVVLDKILRHGLDDNLSILKTLTGSRERSLSITKLQESIMWLGMDLKRLNEPNPYPNSYNSTNDKVEPTADNLKL